MHHHHHHRKKIGIPRGLLPHIILVLLKTEPMSGSELTELIEEYTEWRPSPGSMYPLLKDLQDRNLIEPYEDQIIGLKRLILTEKGMKELEKHSSHEEEFRKRNRSLRKMYWKLLKGMPEDVYNSFAGLVDSLDSTWGSINYDDFTRFKEILDNTKTELDKLGKKQNE
ncbi:PadR family transcriptional regulator [Thermoproteota archaeon]